MDIQCVEVSQVEACLGSRVLSNRILGFIEVL